MGSAYWPEFLETRRDLMDITAQERNLMTIMAMYSIAVFEWIYPEVQVLPVDRSYQNREEYMTDIVAKRGEAQSFYRLSVLGGADAAIRNEWVADITKYVEDWPLAETVLAPGTPGWLVWAPAWSDGRCYAIPSSGFSTKGISYRRDWFKEAGLFNELGIAGPPLDWTIDEFVEISKKLTDSKKNRWGYEIPLGDVGAFYREWADVSFHAPITVPDTTGRYTWKAGFATSQSVKILQFFNDLVYEQKAARAGVEINRGTISGDFWSANRLAMFQGGLSGAGRRFLFGLTPGRDPESLGTAPFPKGPEETRTVAVTGRLWGINPLMSEKQIEATFQFMNFSFSNPRGYEMFFQQIAQSDLSTFGRGMDRLNDGYPYQPFSKKLYPSDLPTGWHDAIPSHFAKVEDFVESELVLPQSIEFKIPGVGTSLDREITSMVQEALAGPNVDLESVAEKYADAADKSVLNYKAEGVTKENFEAYYTVLDSFYKENFPTYYEKVFSELFEKYYKIW